MATTSAFTVLHGAPNSPVVLHVPHTGTHIPTHVRGGILLDDIELDIELASLTDAHTDRLARDTRDLATRRPHALINHLSRFVVDPERFPDDREEMTAAGMAAVYTRGTRGQQLRHPDPARDQALLDTYYHPYTQAMTDLVEHLLTQSGYAVVLDIHSYPRCALPYELHNDGPRPGICLGTDPDHTPDWLLTLARRALEPIDDIALNTPFAGTYVPLQHYRREPRVASLMIEFRRDLYMTEPGGRLGIGAALLPVAIARLVDGVTAHLQAGH